MVKKMHRKDIRIDDVTQALLTELVLQNSTDEKRAKEAAVIRSAIYRMAQQDLPAEQFALLVVDSVSMHKVVTDL